MEILDGAHQHDDIDAFIDSIDPTTMRDGRHLREIHSALRGVEDANQALIEAIRGARRAGDSWAMIAIALGTSRQSAHRKYAAAVGENSQSGK